MLDNFYNYKIIEISDEKLIAKITLNKDHKVYKGHFPEMPITPGVCQVQMVKEILSLELKKNLKLITAKDIKFLSMINPMETSELDIEVKLKTLENNDITINGLMTAEGRKFLKIRAVFAEC